MSQTESKICGERSRQSHCPHSIAAAPPQFIRAPTEKKVDRRPRAIEPLERASLQRRAEVEIRESNPDLAKVLGLSIDKERMLFDALTEQAVELQELNSQRAFRGGTYAERRALQDEIESLMLIQQQRLNELLGFPLFERYMAYQQTLPEHQQVAALRGQLTEREKLSTEQEARLVAAMYEERQQYFEGSPSRANAVGFVWAYPFVGLPDKKVESDARQRFAQEETVRVGAFIDRLHGRAASILTREQLRYFDAMQQRQWASQREALDRMRAPPDSGP